MVTPSLMHVHDITSHAHLSSRATQWAKTIFLCQICGHASIIAAFKHKILGPIVIPEEHTLLLPKSFFTRHHVWADTNSSDIRTPLYANVEKKIVKNFASRAISIPVRIRDVIHRFTTPVSTPDPSLPSKIADV